MRLSGSKFIKRTVIALFALTVVCTSGAVELAGHLDHSARSTTSITADAASAPVAPNGEEWGH